MEVEAARKKTAFKNRASNDLELVRHMRMRHVAQSRGLLHNHGVLLSGFAVADAAGAERADAGGHNRLDPNALASERSSVASADEALSDDDLPSLLSCSTRSSEASDDRDELREELHAVAEALERALEAATARACVRCTNVHHTHGPRCHKGTMSDVQY